MRLLVTPARTLNDEALDTRVVDAPPGASITLYSRLVDDSARCWEAHASYIADERGTIDLSARAPIEGTYTGADPMGLVWSMELVDGNKVGGSIKKSLQPTVLTLAAERDGTRVETKAERLFIADGVRRIPVREAGLVGTLFLPPGDDPFPGILVFTGSGGGIEEGRAALLASHGFAAFALAYFFADGLPQALIEIPLEYFRRGLDWMAARPEVRGRLGITGGSRGGELVLLLGSTYTDIGAVVSNVPSHVTWAGFGPDTEGQRPEPAAWTLGGQAIQPMPSAYDGVELDLNEGDPIPLTPYFLKALENQAAIELSAIPVERIQAPVLLISGEADAMWPSSLMAAEAMKRFERNGHSFVHRHIAYPNAGHSIRPPYIPTTVTDMLHPVSGDLFALGGTPAGNAAANEDSWRETLTFFAEHLDL